MTASALYSGVVVHRRHAPRPHRLRYALIQMLLDLEELPRLHRGLRCFGFNSFALFSFHERDHLSGQGALRPQIEAMLTERGISAPGPVRVLCMPRVLGYVFNPLSLYYCHKASGALAAVILEVNNTFGERHCYVIEAGPEPIVRSRWPKTFFVSPFLDLDMVYDARLSLPADEVVTSIVGRRPTGEALISAVFAGRRRAMSDRALVAAFLQHPLMTLKVILAIHLEAAKLLIKGVRLQPRPSAAAPADLPGSAPAVR